MNTNYFFCVLSGVDKETDPLDWDARLKIALGAARGLAYLHEDSNPRVIHRDFKASNILLEYDFTPKVSDFGLARSALEEGKRHISTHVMGTFGYELLNYIINSSHSLYHCCANLFACVPKTCSFPR